MEAEILRTIIAAMEPSDCPLGAAFHQDAARANALQKLFRRQQVAQRHWNRARTELRELQAERAEVEQELPAAVDRPSPNLPKPSLRRPIRLRPFNTPNGAIGFIPNP